MLHLEFTLWEYNSFKIKYSPNVLVFSVYYHLGVKASPATGT